jgi:hypothetical protein
VSIVAFPAPEAVDARFPASAPASGHISTQNGHPAHATHDHIAAVDGHAMPRQAYALVMVHANWRMLLWEVARLTQLTQKFPLADAHTGSILQQFAARLDAAHEALAAVVTPEMQAAFDAENALFETDMQRYNKRMRRQRPAVEEVRHG